MDIDIHHINKNIRWGFEIFLKFKGGETWKWLRNPDLVYVTNRARGIDHFSFYCVLKLIVYISFSPDSREQNFAPSLSQIDPYNRPFNAILHLTGRLLNNPL